MKFVIYFFVTSVLHLSLPTSLLANCADMTLPFDKKVERSNWIFTGIALKDQKEKVDSVGLNASVTVEVKTVYKGKPAKIEKIYYRSASSGDDCDPKTVGAFLPKSKEKFEKLFYSENIEGKQSTSKELEGGRVGYGHVPKEMKKLSEQFKQK